MKENLNLYRILISVFLCTGIVLGYMNFSVMKNIYSIKTSSINNIITNETPVKKYGYSDVLNLLEEDINLEILNIISEIENTDIISIDIKYNSTLNDLNNTLEKIKSEPCFVAMENISIDKLKSDMLNISFTAVFLKNK
jgi:hypothetical protein